MWPHSPGLQTFKQIGRLHSLLWWALPRHGVMLYGVLSGEDGRSRGEAVPSGRGREMTGGESAPVCEQITTAITNDYQA